MIEIYVEFYKFRFNFKLLSLKELMINFLLYFAMDILCIFNK